MKGAIFYSGQYGSTAQYADWISAETGLPVFNVKDREADPSRYDFLVLGSSVITFNLTNKKLVARHLDDIGDKPVILFTVSGASAGEKLTGWVKSSLPESFVNQAHHVALRGRMDPGSMPWWTRLILRIGAMMNKDPQSRKDELEGFDYMERETIAPIVERIKNWQVKSAPPAKAA